MTLLAYLSGPMRGRPDGNRRSFERAAARLRHLGYLVWSPLEHDDAAGVEAGAELTEAELKRAMRWDIRRVLDADIVVFLPDWYLSRGCKAEHLVAWYADKFCCSWMNNRLVRMGPYGEPLVTLVPGGAGSLARI